MQEGIEKSTPDKNGIYFYPNYRSLKQVSNPPPTLSTLTYQLPQISIILHPAPRYGFTVHFIDTTLPPILSAVVIPLGWCTPLIVYDVDTI